MGGPSGFGFSAKSSLATSPTRTSPSPSARRPGQPCCARDSMDVIKPHFDSRSCLVEIEVLSASHQLPAELLAAAGGI
jgi:hypothetical protein